MPCCTKLCNSGMDAVQILLQFTLLITQVIAVYFKATFSDEEAMKVQLEKGAGEVATVNLRK